MDIFVQMRKIGRVDEEPNDIIFTQIHGKCDYFLNNTTIYVMSLVKHDDIA